MTITVRPATEADANAIAQVHVDAWKTAYRGVVPEPYLDQLHVEERAGVWKRILTGDLVVDGIPRPSDFVAESEGEVRGFANVGRFRDQPEDQASGELWAMYVAPTSWGTGVGALLMAATIDEFRRIGCTDAFLWVLEANTRARSFYERRGWSCDDETKLFAVAGTELVEIRYSIRVDEPSSV